MSAAPTHVVDHAGGDVIDRHRHDDHQLIYVSAGVLAIRTERGAWVASPDRAIWIPAGTWHEHRVYGQTVLHSVGFSTTVGFSAAPGVEADSEFETEFEKPPLAAGSPTVLAANGLVRELIIGCTEPGLEPGEARRLRAVLRDRLRRAHTQPLSLPAARDPRLAHACGLVTDDLRRPRTLTWLARTVGTSERTLTRLFRTEFGSTYPQWRTRTRIFHAMVRLAEGAQVTETAHDCGWATTSAFIDTFVRAMGQTPGAYRAAAVPTVPT